MIKLEGIFAPVVTTFHSGSEDLDVDGFAKNVQSHIAEGLGGVVVAGGAVVVVDGGTVVVVVVLDVVVE